jgi:hypothetical protein
MGRSADDHGPVDSITARANVGIGQVRGCSRIGSLVGTASESHMGQRSGPAWKDSDELSRLVGLTRILRDHDVHLRNVQRRLARGESLCSHVRTADHVSDSHEDDKPCHRQPDRDHLPSGKRHRIK